MKLKSTILAAALSASLASTAFAGETQQTFGAADMQQLFGKKSESTQLATLSQKEMKETEGALSILSVVGSVLSSVNLSTTSSLVSSVIDPFVSQSTVTSVSGISTTVSPISGISTSTPQNPTLTGVSSAGGSTLLQNQQQLQEYNRILEMQIRILQMEHDNKKAVIQNFRI